MKYHSLTYPPPPPIRAPTLFSVTQHHENLWDSPIPYAWRNYWTAPKDDWLASIFLKEEQERRTYFTSENLNMKNYSYSNNKYVEKNMAKIVT